MSATMHDRLHGNAKLPESERHPYKTSRRFVKGKLDIKPLMSQRQVADELGISRAAVSAIEKRALAKLRMGR